METGLRARPLKARYSVNYSVSSAVHREAWRAKAHGNERGKIARAAFRPFRPFGPFRPFACALFSE